MKKKQPIDPNAHVDAVVFIQDLGIPDPDNENQTVWRTYASICPNAGYALNVFAETPCLWSETFSGTYAELDKKLEKFRYYIKHRDEFYAEYGNLL